MRLMTNRIPMGKAKSFDDIVKKFQEDKVGVVKTASVKVASEDEAPSSGQPEAEGKLVNNPKVEAKTEEKLEKEAKELTPAQEKLPDALKEKIRGSDGGDDNKEDDKEDDKEEDKEEIKEAGKTERGKCDGTGPFEGSRQEEEVGIGKKKQRGEKCPVKEDKKDKEAKAKPGYVKLANLDNKSRSWLSEYWKKLYPVEFVDAMLADK